MCISGKTDGGALQTCVVFATELTEHVGVCIVSWLVGAEQCVTPNGLPETNLLYNRFAQNKQTLTVPTSGKRKPEPTLARMFLMGKTKSVGTPFLLGS